MKLNWTVCLIGSIAKCTCVTGIFNFPRFMAMAVTSTMVHISQWALRSSMPPMDKLMLFPTSIHTKVISHILHLPTEAIWINLSGFSSINHHPLPATTPAHKERNLTCNWNWLHSCFHNKGSAVKLVLRDLMWSQHSYIALYTPFEAYRTLTTACLRRKSTRARRRCDFVIQYSIWVIDGAFHTSAALIPSLII